MLHLSHQEPPGPDEALWDITRLAGFLGYSAASIKTMASRNPDRLPPRAPTKMVRWSPAVVRAWVARGQQQPSPTEQPDPQRHRGGRPRER